MRFKIIAIKENLILIIEDEPDAANLMREYLKNSGLSTNIRIVGNYKDAKKAIDKYPFDLILADKALPDGNSLELIIKQGGLSTKPILVVTGDHNLKEKTVVKMGGQGVLHKPFNYGSFIEACEISMERWKPLQTAWEEKRMAESRERTISCYHGITQLFELKNLVLQEKIEKILKIIQDGFPNSEDLSIRISLNGSSCQTTRYEESEHKIEYPIVINDFSVIGSIMIFSKELFNQDTKTVLPKEMDQFLSDVSKRVSILYERNETQKANNKDKALFEATFNKSDNPKMIIDTDGKVMMVNQAAIKFTGVDDSLIIGKKFIDLNWSTIQSQQSILSQAMILSLQNKPVIFDYFCQSTHFECTHFTISLIPVHFGGNQVVFLEASDNTKHKNLVHRIMQYQEMVLGSREAYVGMDQNGKLTPINPAWENITGYNMSKIEMIQAENNQTIPSETFEAKDNPKMQLPSNLDLPKNSMEEYQNSSLNIDQLLQKTSKDKFWLKVNEFFRFNQGSSQAFDLGEYELIAKDGTSRYVSISILPDTKESRLTGYILNIHDNTELKTKQNQIETQNEELKALADKDSLTNLNNRRVITSLINVKFAESTRYNWNLGIIMMDLDFFKKVNDTYGHNAGDEVLRQTARIIESNVREVDIPARWGGEEFLILLPNTDKEGIKIVAERIRKAIEAFSFCYEGKIIPVTASLGASLLDHSGIDRKIEKAPDKLVDFADKALYTSKQTGRNRVTLAD